MTSIAIPSLSSTSVGGVIGGEFATVGPSGAMASQADVSRFQQLLSASPASAEAVGKPASASTPVAGGGLSDAVSSGIKQAAEAFRSRFDALQAGVKQVEKSQSVTGLIALQLDSVKMGVEMEFTGKIASKIVQDIEQLTKQQG